MARRVGAITWGDPFDAAAPIVWGPTIDRKMVRVEGKPVVFETEKQALAFARSALRAVEKAEAFESNRKGGSSPKNTPSPPLPGDPA